MGMQSIIIRAYRNRHNISQPEFAKMLGVAQPIISYIENNKREISPDLALAIEKATNGEIKAEWLIFPEKYKKEIEEYIFEGVEV